MTSPKTHLVKQILPNSRLLIIGPLELERQNLQKKIDDFRPTLIILVDGGVNHRSFLSPKLQAITLSVGDGDSNHKSLEDLDIKLPTEKDFSDLSFVIDCILKSTRNIKALLFLGFSTYQIKEERIDHLLFNIGGLFKLSKKVAFPFYMDEKYLFLPVGSHLFEYHGLFSIISLTKSKIKIGGEVKYPLREWTKIDFLSSHGLSNQAHGKILLETITPILVYFCF